MAEKWKVPLYKMFYFQLVHWYCGSQFIMKYHNGTYYMLNKLNSHDDHGNDVSLKTHFTIEEFLYFIETYCHAMYLSDSQTPSSTDLHNAFYLIIYVDYAGDGEKKQDIIHYRFDKIRDENGMIELLRFGMMFIKELTECNKTKYQVCHDNAIIISGAQTHIKLSSTKDVLGNRVYVIFHDNDDVSYIRNIELFRMFLKLRMRYARYLEHNGFEKDYYSLHGHDSEYLLNDACENLE